MRCKNCHRFRSCLEGSFFENTKLSISIILQLMFLWWCNIGQSDAEHVLGTKFSSKTLVDYLQFFRDICSWKLIETPELTQIGGPGHIVQVDESVITKRKNTTEGKERANVGSRAVSIPFIKGA